MGRVPALRVEGTSILAGFLTVTGSNAKFVGYTIGGFVPCTPTVIDFHDGA